MSNHGQLTILTSAQRTDFALGKGRVHCELVSVSWPSPDGEKIYSFENWLADSVYATPLSTWLDGRDLIPAFVPTSPNQRFHDIQRTSSIGDDVVTMRFSNKGRAIENLIRTHGSGVKVEFFWFFPNVDGGTAVSWFLGYLRTPSGHGAINKDFVTLTAASGFRSANMLIPNLSHPQQCPVRFGGQMTYEELRLGHPCDYNRHLTGPEQTALGGARGLLNADGDPFPTCPHTIAGDLERMGDLLSYTGVATVTETVPVGAGEHKTYSTTHGRYGSLSEPSSVVFGEREVTCVLLDYRKEVNPDSDHLDAGTLVTLFEACLGPVESATEWMLMERTPQGIDMRLGEQQQTATVFSPSAPSLNRRVVANLNQNPTDPSQVQVEQMKATVKIQGFNDVRIYSDQNTWTEEYTNNRAWALLCILENTWWGFRLDRSRLLVSDFIYLAALNVAFDCQVTARSAQQQISDTCESAPWYPPFNHNGVMRFLPIEALDTAAADIPNFTDAGATRNIVVNEGISSLTVAYKDDDEIPNKVVLQFDDAEHSNITRPLQFEDWSQQARAGDVYGDNTKRLVERSYTAYGITRLADAVPLGAFLRDVGPFGNGGIANNLEITFVTRPAIFSDALELHENKAIRVISDKLDGYNDPNGDPFEIFIIKRLQRTSDADLIVTAQAYGKSYYDSLCTPFSGYIHWDTEYTGGGTPSATVIPGPHGSDTQLQAPTSEDGGGGLSWPTTLSASDIQIFRWTHTVADMPTDYYRITHPAGPIGYLVYADGSALIYTAYGLDGTTLPAGSIQAGDTLGYEFNRPAANSYYKHNGTIILTTAATGDPIHLIGGLINTAGDVVGEVYWEAYPCIPTDEQEAGTTGGGTVEADGAGYGFERYGESYGQ